MFTAHHPQLITPCRFFVQPMSQVGSYPARRLLVLGGDDRLRLALIVSTSTACPNARITVANPIDTVRFDTRKVFHRLGVREVSCDRASACAAALRNDSYDWLVDLSARSASGLAFLRHALRGHVRHYLFVSDARIYLPFASLFSHRPLNEDLVEPLHARTLLQRSYLAERGHARATLEQEDALWHSQDGCATVVRFPSRIGMQRHARLLLLAEANEVQLSPASQVPVSFIDSRTAASALLYLMRAPQNETCGRAFNVAQPPTSLAQLLAASTAATGTAFTPEPALLPPTAVEAVYGLVPFVALLPLVIDTQRLRALGWTPPVTLRGAAAEASRHIYEQLLRPGALAREGPTVRHQLESDRARLVDRLPDYIAAAPNVQAVLKRHALNCSVPIIPTEPHPVALKRLLSFALVSMALPSFSCFAASRPSLRPSLPLCLPIAWLLPWAILLVSGHMDAVALGFMSSMLRVRLSLEACSLLLWPYGFNYVTVPAEIGFALFCVTWPLLERCCPRASRLRQASAIARATRLDAPACAALIAACVAVTYFLFVHKLGAGSRFQGRGVGGTRSHREKVLPLVIASHEAFQTWHNAIVVVVVYGIFALSVVRYLRFAFAYALACPRRPSSMLALGFPTCHMLWTTLFETHHAQRTFKHKSPTGRTAAILNLWYYFGFLPALALFFRLSRQVRSGSDALSAPESATLLKTCDEWGCSTDSERKRQVGTEKRWSIEGHQDSAPPGLHAGASCCERLHLSGSFIAPFACYYAISLILWLKYGK